MVISSSLLIAMNGMKTVFIKWIDASSDSPIFIPIQLKIPVFLFILGIFITASNSWCDFNVSTTTRSSFTHTIIWYDYFASGFLFFSHNNSMFPSFGVYKSRGFFGTHSLLAIHHASHDKILYQWKANKETDCFLSFSLSAFWMRMIFRLKWHCSHVRTHKYIDTQTHIEFQGIVSSQNVCICFFFCLV